MRAAVSRFGLLLLAGSLLAGCASTSYFPPSLLAATVPCEFGEDPNGWPVMNENHAAWYSLHLRAAGEPRLGEAPPPHETGGIGVLRFTWLRTFHAPVVVRTEAAGNGGMKLVATELSGMGGYDPGHVARRIERRLSEEETARLITLLDETDVLTLTPNEDCPYEEDGSIIIRADGARWIIEANGLGGYRFVDRWSADGPVRDLGLHLIGLTGWTYDRVY